MLLDLNNLPTVYICSTPVDLRKGIDGYAELVQRQMRLNPIDGSLYLFTNRAKKKLKGILFN